MTIWCTIVWSDPDPGNNSDTANLIRTRTDPDKQPLIMVIQKSAAFSWSAHSPQQPVFFMDQYLWKLWWVSEGLHLSFDLVSAGLDGHPSHVEPEGEQALLTLQIWQSYQQRLQLLYN